VTTAAYTKAPEIGVEVEFISFGASFVGFGAYSSHLPTHPPARVGRHGGRCWPPLGWHCSRSACGCGCDVVVLLPLLPLPLVRLQVGQLTRGIDIRWAARNGVAMLLPVILLFVSFFVVLFYW